MKLIPCVVNHPARFNNKTKDCDVKGFFAHYQEQAGFAEYRYQIDLDLVQELFKLMRMASPMKEACYAYYLDVYKNYCIENQSPGGYNPRLKNSPHATTFLRYAGSFLSGKHAEAKRVYISGMMYKNLYENAFPRRYYCAEGLVACRLWILKNAALNKKNTVNFSSFAEAPADISMQPARAKNKRVGEKLEGEEQAVPQKKRRTGEHSMNPILTDVDPTEGASIQSIEALLASLPPLPETYEEPKEKSIQEQRRPSEDCSVSHTLPTVVSNSGALMQSPESASDRPPVSSAEGPTVFLPSLHFPLLSSSVEQPTASQLFLGEKPSEEERSVIVLGAADSAPETDRLDVFRPFIPLHVGFFSPPPLELFKSEGNLPPRLGGPSRE